MTAPGATRVLFACDGAAIPAEVARAGWGPPLEINATGPKPSLNLKVESLAGKVIASLDGRAQDLVRIAAACYAADQMVSRGGTDIHREHWRRELCLVVPVIAWSFWAEEATRTALTEALGFGTEDTWRFHFVPRPSEFAQMRLDFADRPLMGLPDSVLLVSGGTDSLCALVEALAAQERRPLAVSHRSAPQIDSWQKALLDAVRTRFPHWTVPPVSFWIHKTNTTGRDSSQRTRGFLYAALGTAMAGQIGLDRVLLPDNGYVSINPPISGQLVGALASRGTHPAFIRLFNRLAGLVFPDSVQVENPLADRTRAEALRILAAHKAPALLERTHTCGKHRTRTKEKPHCGGCSQCIDRRFAAIAAGLKKHDPASRYELDVFRHGVPKGEARTIAFAYADFARKSKRLTPSQYFLEYEELVACLDPDHPTFSAHAEQVGLLLQRHGREVRRVYTHEARVNLGALLDLELPEFSLLRMLAASQSVAELTADEPADLDPAPVPVEPADAAELYFRHRGTHWFFSFHGQKGQLDDRQGVRRLARLLKAPGQELFALDLVAGSVASNTPHPEEDIGDEDAERTGFGRAQPGRLGRRSVPPEIGNKKRRARELEQRLAADGDLLSDEKRDRIRVELEEIADFLLANEGYGGRARGEVDEYEKARTSVWHSIHDAYKAIALEVPDLATHLRDSTTVGIRCCYDPRPREHWDVVL